MLLYSSGAMRKADIVADHRTKPEHDDLANIMNVQRRVKAIGLEGLPSQAIFITERRNLLTQNIAQKPQLKTFVKSIRRDDYRFLVLKKQNLASFGIGIKLKQAKNDCSNRQ